ncbi:MAG: protein translocase subunit SecD [Austwickia sp.]|nr:protein translocase subunit SecD [Austwickia sp.]MBK8435222.1 protein translocase subunit SecD [Austwickia sp.]MBK9101225.1 protein translocase subunit SecD [Austwickia sp.]
MLALTLGLVALLLGAHTWGTAQLSPKLGLDLEGGQQVILQPQVRGGQEVNAEELARAVDIMRNRVDGQGVSEAEVATLGQRITVTVPGRMTQAQQDALRRSSQMRFRPVLEFQPASLSIDPQPAPTPANPTTAPPKTTPTATATPTASAKPSAAGSGGAQEAPAGVDPGQALPAATTTPAPTPRPAATPTPAPGSLLTTQPAPALKPGQTPTYSSVLEQDPKALIAYATNQAWATPAYLEKLTVLDCTKQPPYDPKTEDLTKPIVSCSDDRQAKYLLGPSVMVGGEIANALARPGTNQQGQPDGTFEVALTTTGEAKTKYAEVSRYMLPLQQPRNQLAAVLDGQVISAPYFQGVIADGNASISGNFTAETAKLLADQLKFGALPMSFVPESSLDISPTLGGDQLRKGLIAGLIGLLLVIVYSLLQYRALGLVTIASLVLVALLTYLCLTLFGWSSNLRLTMAGITGAIVAIGTTADSFIVYFERVRDEVREGRTLRAAVETGWARARRTILISDAVNLLAALVLYLLATSNVRGFAFMLILTTILDVIVTFLFTHPLLTMLASTKFFGGGHRWSGFDPERLGADKFRYVGAGRFRGGDRPRVAGAARGHAATGASEGGRA